jgi:hypothetical protein
MTKEKNWALAAALFAVVVMATYLLACATTSTPPADSRMLSSDTWVETTVTSFAAPDPILSKAYYLASGNQDVPDSDLEFQTYARYIENALSPKGYVRTYDVKNADIVIRLAYGIGDPKTTTGTRTTGYGYGYYTGYFWYYTPPATETVSATTYKRTLILEAYDLKDPEKKSQLWKTTAISVGTYSDLGRILAYMIVGSAPYIGTNTVIQETVRVYGYDPRLLEIWK